MSSSKVKPPDIKEYFLNAGVNPNLLLQGFVATVHAVFRDHVQLVMPCGERRVVHFQLDNLATPEKSQKLQRWRRLLFDAQHTSAPIRWLGATHSAGSDWVASSSSLILKQATLLSSGDIGIYELFAGGVGGWSRIVDYLHGLGIPVVCKGATEICPTMAAMWNQGKQSRHASDDPVPTCAIADVTAEDTWDEIMMCNAQVFTVSNSCRSFSLGGRLRGWQCKDGETLAITLLRLQQHGVRCIAFENVPAIRDDETMFAWFLAVLDYCGLTILSMGTFGISPCHPAERTRLLILLKQKSDAQLQPAQQCDPFALFRDKPIPNMWTADRWIHMPETLADSCKLDEGILQQYLKPHSMTQHMKSRIHDSSVHARLAARCTRSNMQMAAGTVMANYGKQHEITSVQNPKIYGYLKQTGELSARFFHSVEIVLCLGVTGEITLPLQEEAAKHAVGNSISECHALIILVHGLDSWRVFFPWLPSLNLPALVLQHTMSCLTTKTATISWDDQWIKISRKTQTGDRVPVVQTMIAEDNSSDSSGQDCASDIVPVQGSKRKLFAISTAENGIAEPPFKVICFDDTTILQIIVAEAQMEPSLSHLRTCDQDGNMCSANQTISDRQIMLCRQRNEQDRFDGAILVTDDTVGFELNCNSYDALSQWSFNGKSLLEFECADSLGHPLDPREMIGFRQHVSVSSFGLQPSEKPCHIKVVRIHNKSIHVQEVKFDRNDDVESLLVAEQILLGPQERICKVHDRFACDLARMKPLVEIDMIVIHIEEAHQLIEVTTIKLGITRKRWVARGTRVFQIEPIDGLLVIDQNGKDTPGDMPLVATCTLHWVERLSEEEDDLTPTVPFTIHDPSEEHSRATSYGTTIAQLVQTSTNAIREAISHARTSAPWSLNPWQTVARIRSLCTTGLPIADDEMTWIIDRLGPRLSGSFVGIIQWADHECVWKWNARWNEATIPADVHYVVPMLYHEEHWVPAIINRLDTEVVIAKNTRFDHMTEVQLLQFLGIPEFAIRYESVPSIHGLCGWIAIKWLLDQLRFGAIDGITNRLIVRDDDPILRIEGAVGRSLCQSYMNKLQQMPDNLRELMILRKAFEDELFLNPSMECFVGYAGDGQANLKLVGKVASILIGHGHDAQEASEVAQKVAMHHAKQARQLLTQKDAKSYSTLLQICVQHGISVKNIGSTAAATKLQAFFRKRFSKKQSQRQDAPLDLSKVSFEDESFVTHSGVKFKPAESWTPTLKGIGVASLDQLSPYIAQDRLLSLETNTAVVSQYVEDGEHIKVTPADVMVQDAMRNRALVRVYLVHFGQVKVQPAEVHGCDVMVETQAQEVIVLSVIRNLVEPAFWDKMVSGPAKTILGAYFHDAEQLQVTQLWSRRWSCGNKPSSPREADSFSVLLRVRAEDATGWLRRSGGGPVPIFASMKIMSDTETKSDQRRVIWISKSIHNAVASLTQVPDHLGIVHRRPSSFGIRFDQKRFPTAWKELRGDESIPNLLPIKMKFIINGVPFGLTGASLEAWSKEIDWPLRTLKRFSDNRYLVGSETAPPSFHLTIGKKPVIVTAYENKPQKQDPQILLGKLQVPDPKGKNENQGEDTLFTDDPWTKFRQREGLVTHAPVPKQAAKVKDQTMPAPDDATTELIAKQSTRLADVEAEILSIKSQMAQDQQSTQARFSQVDNTIQAMGSSLKNSLEEALKQQSASLVQTFEALLKKSPRERISRSRSPPAK